MIVMPPFEHSAFKKFNRNYLDKVNRTPNLVGIHRRAFKEGSFYAVTAIRGESNSRLSKDSALTE